MSFVPLATDILHHPESRSTSARLDTRRDQRVSQLGLDLCRIRSGTEPLVAHGQILSPKPTQEHVKPGRSHARIPFKARPFEVLHG